MDGDVVSRTAVDAAETYTHIAGVIVDGQLGDSVLVIGHIVTQVPVQVPADNGASGDGELNPFVDQLTHVRKQLVAEVGSGCDTYCIQEVRGLAVVEVKSTGDTVVEEAIIKTGVIGCSLFPFQVLIIRQRADQ